MLDLNRKMLEYEKQGMLSFHTPGHKGKTQFFCDLHFPQQDLTELPELDMLHSPEGVIAKAQERAAQVYGSDAAFFLVNGATVGNQGMFMALASERGKSSPKVLVERQSHRSVMSALILSGLEPEYIPGIVHPEFALPLGCKLPEEDSLADFSAVHITYPSYYGTGLALEKLADLREKKYPELCILVDQAHGSHYLNPFFPPGAIQMGADLVVHSTHKTLSALTQSAMLHVKGQRIEVSALKRALEILQSSSPSYLLLASLERAVEYALEKERWEALYDEVQELHYQVGKVLRILNQKDIGTYGISIWDWSKILINTKPLGVSAPVCVNHLRQNYGIEPELWDEDNILFVLGIGNTAQEVRSLTQGLLSLANLKEKDKKDHRKDKSRFHDSLSCIEAMPLPPRRLTPRQAFLAKKRQIPLEESLGKIVGESISPYPPGIPLVVMGEEMTPEILEFLKHYQGRWQGWEAKGHRVWVIEED